MLLRRLQEFLRLLYGFSSEDMRFPVSSLFFYERKAVCIFLSEFFFRWGKSGRCRGYMENSLFRVYTIDVSRM